VRSNVEKNPIAGQKTRAAITELHFQRFRRDKAPCAHGQFGAGRFVILQMCRDFALDHVALALADGPHIRGDVAG
jgi:hypothetical protein